MHKEALQWLIICLLYTVFVFTLFRDIKDADAEMLSPTTDSPVAVSSSSLGSLAFTCLKQLTTSPAVTSYPALLTPVFNYLHSIGWTSTQCCSSILTVIINESGGRKNNIVADTCLQGLLNYVSGEGFEL